MPTKKPKKSVFTRIRNNFIAGIVVLIPIGITLYLTLAIAKVSSKILPKEINPNNYLPYNIPGIEIIIALLLITLIGWLSLSFIGKKLLNKFNNFFPKKDKDNQPIAVINSIAVNISTPGISYGK